MHTLTHIYNAYTHIYNVYRQHERKRPWTWQIQAGGSMVMGVIRVIRVIRDVILGVVWLWVYIRVRVLAVGVSLCVCVCVFMLLTNTPIDMEIHA